MYANETRFSGRQIARKLEMSPKYVNKLMTRIKKYGTLVPRKRGK